MLRGRLSSRKHKWRRHVAGTRKLFAAKRYMVASGAVESGEAARLPNEWAEAFCIVLCHRTCIHGCPGVGIAMCNKGAMAINIQSRFSTTYST